MIKHCTIREKGNQKERFLLVTGTRSWAETPRAKPNSRSRGHTPILPYNTHAHTHTHRMQNKRNCTLVNNNNL